MKYSVIIPVYKNKSLFFENLRINYPLIKHHEVIVVDDASNDHIKEELKQLFPEIIVIENDKNVGFGPTVNKGVLKSTGDILILLNSDVRLIKPFDHLKNFFEKDNMLFAISFAQIEKDKKITGKNKLFFRNGFAEHSKANDLVSGKNSWAEGGAAAIKADYFKQLGGFRDIYAPFYWEDIDLSYRAYKSNWHVMFVADYVVEHHHESTIGTYFSNMFVKKIAYRNQLFFIWTNIQDGSLLFNHVCALPIQVVRTILKGDFAFISALASAFFSMPEVLNTRSINKKNAHMTDRSVFATL